jgi:hypothetical protein
MLRTFFIYFVPFSASVPGGAASGYALMAAADRADFGTQFPATHEKLAYFLNYLLYITVEHTFPYLLVCALAAFIWALIIAEPKAVAKRKFKERRLKVRS